MVLEIITGLFSQAFAFICSPLHLIILILTGFLVYTIMKQRAARMARYAKAAIMQMDPVMPPQFMNLTLEELSEYDGVQHEGRMLIAVNGHIFDVTQASDTYEPGATCARFAGRDMTRSLARLEPHDDNQTEFDDFSGLTHNQMEMVQMWEDQIREEFPLVGKILHPAELPNGYAPESDDQDSGEDSLVMA